MKYKNRLIDLLTTYVNFIGTIEGSEVGEFWIGVRACIYGMNDGILSNEHEENILNIFYAEFLSFMERGSIDEIFNDYLEYEFNIEQMEQLKQNLIDNKIPKFLLKEAQNKLSRYEQLLRDYENLINKWTEYKKLIVT